MQVEKLEGFMKMCQASLPPRWAWDYTWPAEAACLGPKGGPRGCGLAIAPHSPQHSPALPASTQEDGKLNTHHASLPFGQR